MKEKRPTRTVLVGVLKEKRDLPILLLGKWYRIPLAFLPRRAFTHVAFYQPECFGPNGKRIEYYARVASKEVKKRIELLPDEPNHPNAMADYLQVRFKKVEKLLKPIRNVVPRRVSFGFTDLPTLRSSKDILELYHVPPTEQIVEKALKRIGIPITPQYRLSFSSSPPFPSSVEEGWPKAGVVVPSARGVESSRRGGGVKHFRLDMAIFCKNGNIAIECDNDKAHASKIQKAKDRDKDRKLTECGWIVFRLSEKDVLEKLQHSLQRIEAAVRALGGCRDLDNYTFKT